MTQDWEQKCKGLEAELAQAKQEIEIGSWGLTKTNEAIKYLYKELDKKNKELQALDRLKTDFINTVSHELRTPLTTIREAIAQVFDGIHGQTTVAQRDFLLMCLSDVDRLRRLIDDLLDMSKLEAGMFKLARQQIDIVALARDIVSFFYPAAKATNIELRERYNATEPFAYVDRDSIVRIFTNLIGNALKFTDKGYIEVSVIDKPGSVECAVADTGRGIDENEIPRLFNKFEQFGRHRGTKEKGTGLGLSITKSIIDLHRGKIWVESALDKGTTFTFTLPKYNEQQVQVEHLRDVIRDAIRQGVPLSILVFSTGDIDAHRRRLGPGRAAAVIRELAQVVKQNLRRQSDGVIAGDAKFLAVLPGTDKPRSVNVGDRMTQCLVDHIAKNRDMAGVEISYTGVSYPEDGQTEKEIEEHIGEF